VISWLRFMRVYRQATTIDKAMTSAALTSATLRADPALLDSVFARLRERVDAGALPTAALAIGDAGGPIRVESFAGGGMGLRRDSNFFLASLTKPIFATAFMQLVEDGRVGLREPIARVVTEFSAGHKAEVTPWHILTHTSGIPDIDPTVLRRQRPSRARMTQLTLDAPLGFTPGTRWQYCSASFYLLGLVIERVTGMPYVRYLRERLTDPLGMLATFDPRRAGRPIVVVHGVGAENRLRRWFLLRYMAGAAVPGGGLFGTLDDILAFGAATLRPRTIGGRPMPLRAATIEEMCTDQLDGVPGLVDGEERPFHFGLGWGKPTLMRETPGSPRVVAHGGATGTRLWIDPDPELVFVFFTNQWSGDRGPDIEALMGTYRAMERG
jgi:CubicO group peptidase (beta-lactamase class C family)